MAQLSLSQPIPARTPIASGGFTTWWQKWHLALLATLSWIFTFAGFAIDHLTSLPHAAAVGSFALAYLAGGALATKAALDDIAHAKVNVDLLMVIAAVGAAFIGDWAEGAILLSLFSSSNALEAYTLDRTKNAVRALMDLAPERARIERDGRLVEIPVEELQLEEIVYIQPGERIPADGIVISGESAVDQAAITGESIPVTKRAGDNIFAGTISGHGALQARVSSLHGDSTLARIARLVSEAENDKSDLQEFAEGFEGKYATAVILISALVIGIPMMLGHDAYESFYRGMTLLVVMSPCALVISTPAATLSALANAARRGVLVKGGGAMDLLGSVDTIAFDKTGTLTVGRPRLTDIVTFGTTDSDEVLARAAAAEQLSEHPIALAVVQAASSAHLDLPPSSDAKAHPGAGITATVDRSPIAIGNDKLFAELGVAIPDHAREHNRRLGLEGKSTLYIGDTTGIHAVMGVADVLRDGVSDVIRRLHEVGVSKTIMLTGDNERVAAAIADLAGLDEIRADLMPEEKLSFIADLKSRSKVAMVGDGVNDAPALANAHVGIAMGAGGTDVALETADVVLMSNDLSRLAYTIGLSRKMRRIIRANLIFALSVIAVLAVCTLTIGIPLPLGVIGHEGSTVLVCLNGLRLLGYGGSFSSLVGRKDAAPVVDQAPQWKVVTA